MIVIGQGHVQDVESVTTNGVAPVCKEGLCASKDPIVSGLGNRLSSMDGVGRKGAGHCLRVGRGPKRGGLLRRVVHLVLLGNQALAREAVPLAGKSSDGVDGVLQAIYGFVKGEAIISQNGDVYGQAIRLLQADGGESGGQGLAVAIRVICLGLAGQGHA